ncbi:RusA family crossover junction endodeoxyribonuclease [Acinetobacter guerrae]|uniref:RusA family crossover junction endodeoxyribonuclease n=1 Tax=Acinetobacter guerrae TaxID=1843371 RepID=UPI0021CC8043|nr:RusA family crossover junction endodeoxyribonuclease [Acinetobacter guerrae]
MKALVDLKKDFVISNNKSNSMKQPKWGTYRHSFDKKTDGKKKVNKDPLPTLPPYLVKGKTHECMGTEILNCSIQIVPPSINNYWLDSGKACKRLSKRANHFVEVVKRFVPPLEHKGDVRVEINYHMPDNKVRDIDNILKPCLDALVKCGLIIDDSQVKSLTVNARPVVKGCLLDICVMKM